MNEELAQARRELLFTLITQRMIPQSLAYLTEWGNALVGWIVGAIDE